MLLFGAFALGVLLVIAHGLRGVAALVALVLLVSAPQTRVWLVVERFLVKLTGSRRRAAVLVLASVITVALAFEVFSLVHG